MADPLSVAASIAARLADIFRPGVLSPPEKSMTLDDHRLAADVLTFLIENMHSILQGTAIDDEENQQPKERAEENPSVS